MDIRYKDKEARVISRVELSVPEAFACSEALEQQFGRGIPVSQGMASLVDFFRLSRGFKVATVEAGGVIERGGGFKVGDVVRHKASGERFVVVEANEHGCYVCDSGYKGGFRDFSGVVLELAPPLVGNPYSRSSTEVCGGEPCSPVERDDRVWGLSKKDKEQ